MNKHIEGSGEDGKNSHRKKGLLTGSHLLLFVMYQALTYTL